MADDLVPRGTGCEGCRHTTAVDGRRGWLRLGDRRPAEWLCPCCRAEEAARYDAELRDRRAGF